MADSKRGTRLDPAASTGFGAVRGAKEDTGMGVMASLYNAQKMQPLSSHRASIAEIKPI